MSIQVTASNAKTQDRIDQMNLSDDECVQKLAALIELKNSGDLAS